MFIQFQTFCFVSFATSQQRAIIVDGYKRYVTMRMGNASQIMSQQHCSIIYRTCFFVPYTPDFFVNVTIDRADLLLTAKEMHNNLFCDLQMFLSSHYHQIFGIPLKIIHR